MGFKSKTFEQQFWRNAILYARAYETKDEAIRRAEKTMNNRTRIMKLVESTLNIGKFVVYAFANLLFYCLLIVLFYQMVIDTVFLWNNSVKVSKIRCMYNHPEEHLRVCVAPETFSWNDHFMYQVIIFTYGSYKEFWEMGDANQFCEIFLRGLE